jgi:hypothetical protein
MPWGEDEPFQVPAFGLKRNRRILMCSANKDQTRNYLWKLYEYEVIPFSGN